MKIKYRVKDKNSFKVFNDSMGLALNRENIIRSKNVKYLSYLLVSILEIMICLIFLGMMIILCESYPCALSIFLVYFATILSIFMIISVLYPLLFASLVMLREENELEINENGIAFYLDDDQYILLGWTHIRALVIGKKSLNFITDNLYYFYLDKKHKDEILKAVKEYNESLLIIK